VRRPNRGVEIVAAHFAACSALCCAHDAQPAPPVSACHASMLSAIPHAARPGDPVLGVEECPEPISPDSQALNLPQQPDVLLTIRISPWSRPERALTLRRGESGAYVLRSTRDEVRERFVDSKTAELLLTLWSAAVARKGVAATAEVVSVTLDGTGYRVWLESGAISMANPRGALAVAVSGVHQLEDIVNEPASNDDCARLEEAVAEMTDALYRIRHNGPCVRYEQASLPTR